MLENIDSIGFFRIIMTTQSVTGAIESPASTVQEIIAEIAGMRVTERGTRADDQRSEAAMEDRKRQGYF